MIKTGTLLAKAEGHRGIFQKEFNEGKLFQTPVRAKVQTRGPAGYVHRSASSWMGEGVKDALSSNSQVG